MNNDENSTVKKKKRINVVDIIMIVIAAAGIIAAVYFGVTLLGDGFDIRDLGGSKESNVEYDIRMDMVDTSVYSFRKEGDNTVTAAFLKVGDAVYDIESGKKIGEVSAITYRNSLAPTGKADASGELEYAEFPDHIDLTITVEASADNSGGTYRIKDYTVRTGAGIAFHTSGFYGEGVIVRVSEKQLPQAEN